MTINHLGFRYLHLFVLAATLSYGSSDEFSRHHNVPTGVLNHLDVSNTIRRSR